MTQELRRDPVVDRWVIISAGRAKRPFDRAPAAARGAPKSCPFCPGNEDETPPEVTAVRSARGGSKDWSVRVVGNKFPALSPDGEPNEHTDGIYISMDGVGKHEVIIENPDHDLSLARISQKQFKDLLTVYRDRIATLLTDPRFRYVQVFKNHGLEAGASLDHPHSQLVALPIIPSLIEEELRGIAKYNNDEAGRCIYCDIVKKELDEGKRVVLENDDFLVFAPYASRFPYEICLIPKEHRERFEEITDDELESLSTIFQEALRRVDVGLGDPPYNFMIHTAPRDLANSERYHWHIEMTPRLSKVAGFERGTGFFINTVSPESSAEFLRSVHV